MGPLENLNHINTWILVGINWIVSSACARDYLQYVILFETGCAHKFKKYECRCTWKISIVSETKAGNRFFQNFRIFNKGMLGRSGSSVGAYDSRESHAKFCLAHYLLRIIPQLKQKFRCSYEGDIVTSMSSKKDFKDTRSFLHGFHWYTTFDILLRSVRYYYWCVNGI